MDSPKDPSNLFPPKIQVQVWKSALDNLPVNPGDGDLAAMVELGDTTAVTKLHQTACLSKLQSLVADLCRRIGGQIHAHIECSRGSVTQEDQRRVVERGKREKEHAEDIIENGSPQTPTTPTNQMGSSSPYSNFDTKSMDHLQVSQPGPMANLPLWERYQSAHVAIDNLMHYLLAFYSKEDASCSNRQTECEVEICPFIEGLQRASAVAYRRIFKESFPCKSLEIELSASRRREAKERVRPLVEQAEATLEGLKEWAIRSRVEELSRGRIDETIRVKGEGIWAAAFRERQERINTVIAKFTYNGKPLGYVGSMNTGFRGLHKGKTHFDPKDFDVDLYVIDEQEYERERCRNPESRFMDKDKIFPSEETPHLMAFSETVASALAQEFPGVKTVLESTVVLRRVPPW